MVSKFVLALAALATIAGGPAFAGDSSVSPDGSLFILITPHVNPYAAPPAPILGTGQPVGAALLLPAIQAAREAGRRLPIDQYPIGQTSLNQMPN